MYVGLFVKLKDSLISFQKQRRSLSPAQKGLRSLISDQKGREKCREIVNLCSEGKKIAYLYSRTMGG